MKTITTDNNEFLADAVTPNPNYGVVTETGEDDPPPAANHPGNPYFGKTHMTGAAFVGLSIAALGIVAANRLVNDPAFAALKLWLQTADVVLDPDDRDGQFIQLVGLPGADGYLTTALATDGQALMTRAQRDAIMAAWD